ncbi:hypothetical protein B0H66DRAFT_558198 [Apodospora peruviana]|uniref:Thiaminase-2/PQQC domain-containing protein n=1 Tax=Apodospora peruviana TaxID=516989 RepID=A0AAE0I546_9PEZI|nr:hypothetical protein B0H66DRAFT_558198 [Apodospora peruviana]
MLLRSRKMTVKTTIISPARPAQTWSLTEHLLSTFPEEYQRATQHPFLLAAAEGRLPKDVLGKWLANDRLYIHSYIRAAGKLLSAIDLPQVVPKDGEASETQLVDWLIEALAAVRREERLFIDVAGRYGLDVNIGTLGGVSSTEAVVVDEGAKLPGLVMMEDIFRDIQGSTTAAPGAYEMARLNDRPPTTTLLPWLEGAVMFWGTERTYLDAWSWAKSRQPPGKASSDAREDADGGALRNEFIPNWSSVDFGRFVGRLGGLIDFAVSQALERVGEEGADAVKAEIIGRVEAKWKSLLSAEAAFWPQVD